MFDKDAVASIDSAFSMEEIDKKRSVVKGIVDRMCIAYGIEGKDIKGQLAARLGICVTSTVKSWVYHARVPFDAMLTCSADVGCSFDWLMTGEPSSREYGAEFNEKMVSSIKEHLQNSTRYQLLSSDIGITAVAENIVSDIESNLNIKFVKN